MPMFVVLGKFTDQGAKDLPNLRKTVERNTAGGNRLGVKTHGWYLTQGRYDFVILVEAPDAETVLAGSTAAAGLGVGHSETLRAYTVDEFEQVLKKLPPA
jgi:uncharacterized protein with GYD domain